MLKAFRSEHIEEVQGHDVGSCCNPRASNRTQFGLSMRSSSVSSMATIRSSSGRSSMKALSSVVLPLPVPPLTRMFRRVCNIRSAS